MSKNFTRGMTLEDKIAYWLNPEHGHVVSNDGCLVWQGRQRAGYPEISHSIGGVRKWYRLHRLVCQIVHGISDDEVAKHSCGESLCINPDHLDAGTHEENLDERHRTYWLKKKLDYQMVTTKHLVEQIAWSWEDDSPVAVFDQSGHLLNECMEEVNNAN